MDIDKIIKFLKCPYCINTGLIIEDAKLLCSACSNLFDIVEGIPILLKKDTLSRHNSGQLVFFDKHYAEFCAEQYLPEKWRLSMLNRIFGIAFKERINTYLDIGCGATGYTVVEAAKKYGCLSFGADISLEAALKAKGIAKREGLDSTTGFLVCSAENLPFKPNTIDYISAVSLFEHLQDDEAAIRCIYSTLRDNGYLYLCVPNSYKKIPLFLWPIYFYLDYKIGHKRHYSIEGLNHKIKEGYSFALESAFYNGHLIKLWQIILDKMHLVSEDKWWNIERRDINHNPFGLQLNAIYRKK